MEIALEPIIRKARAFERRTRLRNALEWGACAVLIPWCFAHTATADDPIIKVSSLVMGIGALFVAAYLYLNGRVSQLPDPSLDATRYLAAYRQQLLKQARLLSTTPLWYMAPLLAGAVGIVVAGFIRMRAAGKPLTVVIAVGLGIAAFCAVATLINLRKARRLRREADLSR